jgi:2-dehydropantoate 2-reductase
MRIAVLGAGAVGGYFGARLASAGNSVAFIARGEHLAAMRSSGLRVLSDAGDLELPSVTASDDPAEIGIVDLVLFTPKLYGTEAAIEAATPMVGEHTTLLSLQNGIDAADQLRARFGQHRVMGGSCQIAAVIEQPGSIRHSGIGAKLVFGEFDGQRTERLEELEQACRNAGINYEIPPDITVAIWRKFVFLVAFSGATALVAGNAGSIQSDANLHRVFSDLMAETAAVGKARGVALTDDAINGPAKLVAAMPGATTSSLANDLARGNRLETHWLQGTVVRLGQELGILTPVANTVYASLKARDPLT